MRIKIIETDIENVRKKSREIDLHTLNFATLFWHGFFKLSIPL